MLGTYRAPALDSGSTRYSVVAMETTSVEKNQWTFSSLRYEHYPRYSNDPPFQWTKQPQPSITPSVPEDHHRWHVKINSGPRYSERASTEAAFTPSAHLELIRSSSHKTQALRRPPPERCLKLAPAELCKKQIQGPILPSRGGKHISSRNVDHNEFETSRRDYC
ncbi:hypothetical protein POX_h09514 [Penicillium oxalicum]|uniref:hypothetical protein n=1 Tax=Penicillium oxalicum TaxID=69781 RepID=UPI0020B718B2|nr:hypothetical protein POX_h09514 [Penicillium oxalicum]KAI2785755.1 hypothetical protein POX_h09514 [Penicillium oxalicum]